MASILSPKDVHMDEDLFAKDEKSFTDERCVFITGTSCVGKTSIIDFFEENCSQIRGLKLDYAEMCNKHQILVDEKIDPLTRENLLVNFRKEKIDDYRQKYAEDILLIDRTQYCSLFYQAIHKEMRKADSGINYLDTLFQNSKLQKILNSKNIIFLVCSEHYVNQHLEKAKERNNGIDFMDVSYAICQNKIFKYLHTLLPSSYLICFYDKNTEFLTNEYFQGIINILFYILNKEFNYISSKKNIFKKNFYTDAGYDLTLKETTLCEKNKPVFLEVIEKSPELEKNQYGQIVSRSSTQKFGTIRSGIIDYGYTGSLKVCFVPDQTCVVFKNTSIAQLIIMNYISMPNENIKKKYFEKRNNKRFGSSNKKHSIITVPEKYVYFSQQECTEEYEDLLNKWNAQPQDEDMEREYKQDMQLLEYFRDLL